MRLDFADGRGHVRCLGDHLELPALALENDPDPIADHRVVISDDHLDRPVNPWCALLACLTR